MDNWLLTAIIGYTLFGVSTAMDKYFMIKGYQPLSTNLFKMFFDGVILLAIGYFFIGLNFSLELFGWSLLLATVYSLSGLLYFKTIQITDVEMIFPYIQSFVTLFSIFGSIIIFSEPFGPLNYLGLVMILVGVYLVLSKTGRDIPKWNKGLFFASMIVITMVTYSILTKFLLGDIRPIDLGIMMYLCSALIIAFYKFIFKKDNSRLPDFKSAKILISSVFGALGTFFIYTGLDLGAASKVYALAGWESVVIFVLALIFLKQKLLLHRLIGILLIFPGIYLIAV